MYELVGLVLFQGIHFFVGSCSPLVRVRRVRRLLEGVWERYLPLRTASSARGAGKYGILRMGHILVYVGSVRHMHISVVGEPP